MFSLFERWILRLALNTGNVLEGNRCQMFGIYFHSFCLLLPVGMPYKCISRFWRTQHWRISVICVRICYFPYTPSTQRYSQHKLFLVVYAYCVGSVILLFTRYCKPFHRQLSLTLCFACITFYERFIVLLASTLLNVCLNRPVILLFTGMIMKTANQLQRRKWSQILKVTLLTQRVSASRTRMAEKRSRWPKQTTLNTRIQLTTACRKGRLDKLAATLSLWNVQFCAMNAAEYMPSQQKRASGHLLCIGKLN